MKSGIGIKPIKFYLWAGLIFLSLWLIHDLSNYPGTFFPRFLDNIWRTCYLIVINYSLFEYAFPFVWRKRESFVYSILFGIAGLGVYMLLWSYGIYVWRSFGIELGIYTSILTVTTVNHVVALGTGYSVSSVFLFIIIRHFYHYIILQRTTQQLRIEKQEAELNYLRSQTNPHFLFNTLNNIYSLARDKSDLAPESILRLSKILRFMLYETVGDYIAIEQEMKIISDYIALEKLRYDDSLRINFNHDIEDMKQALPPLLLIPLVENAFKHGVSETRHQPFVDIHLSLNHRKLKFVVKNSAEAFPGEGGVKENIGLANLRRQLELLYKEHDLSVQQVDSVFTATLMINLASHV